MTFSIAIRAAASSERRCSAVRRGDGSAVTCRPCCRRCAQEQPDAQGIERQRFRGIERQRRHQRCGVVERAEAAASRGQEPAQGQPVALAVIGVDKEDRRGRGGGGRALVEAQQAHDTGVGRRDPPLRAGQVQDRRLGLDAMRRRDEVPQVDPRRPGLAFPALGRGRDRIERLETAELEAHRHHRPATEPERCQIAGTVERGDRLGLGDARFNREPRRVVVLREGDRGRYAAQLVVLVEEPALVEVPPFAAVEDQIEAAAGEHPRPLERTAQRCGQEDGVWVVLVQPCQKLAPERRRHLVGGAAAETRYAGRQPMARQIDEVGELVLAVGWLVEDELRQVLHVTRPTWIVGVGENWRGELPAGTAAEPVRTFGDQAPVPGRVRQDQVRHDAQALAGRGVDEPANQLGRPRLGPATDTGMQLMRIGHRVDAAGRSGGEEGVDVDPVESHRPHPREMIRPSVDRPGQQWMDVVDARSRLDHRRSLLHQPMPTRQRHRPGGRSSIAGQRQTPKCGHRC